MQALVGWQVFNSNMVKYKLFFYSGTTTEVSCSEHLAIAHFRKFDSANIRQMSMRILWIVPSDEETSIPLSAPLIFF